MNTVGLSAVVIIISVSMAFSAWFRAIIQLLFRVPFELFAEYTGLHEWWAASSLNHVNLERRSVKMLEKVSKRRQQKLANLNEEDEDEPATQAKVDHAQSSSLRRVWEGNGRVRIHVNGNPV
jgi:hypothetical protein